MAKLTAPDTVIPGEYPELALLAWNRDVARPIPADEAFALYERNWRHVDVNRLSENESELIAVLTREFGKGHFLAGSGR